VEIDASEYLPTDQTTGGFDNVATALRMSPTLMERYVSAAEKISRLAVGSTPLPTEVEFKVQEDMQLDRHVDGLPLGTRGGTLIRYSFPVDGEYEVLVKFRRAAEPFNTNMISREDGQAQPFELAVDGEIVKSYLIDSVGKSK